MIKKHIGWSPQSLWSQFGVLNTHKAWSLSNASGLKTYSVQSHGLLRRKVNTQTIKWRIRMEIWITR